MERLREAGVEVQAGLLEAEAQEQNEVFFTVQKKGRPFVLLKAALTLDGKVAALGGDARYVSSLESRRIAQPTGSGFPR